MTETQISYPTGKVPVNEMNLIQRVKGVILSPGRTMESLVEKPRLLLPLIIITAAQLALYLARFPLYQDYLRNSFIKSQSLMEALTGTSLTAEVIDNYMSRSLVQTIITIPLTTLFAWFLTTVVFFAIFKIFGAKGRFKQYMSITAHAYIIKVLYMLVVLAASFFTGSLHIDLPLTSIANLLPAEMSGSFLYGIALSTDIFNIWNYCVIAIGIAAVSGFKKRNSYILFAIIFAVGLLISSFGVIAAQSVTGG